MTGLWSFIGDGVDEDDDEVEAAPARRMPLKLLPPPAPPKPAPAPTPAPIPAAHLEAEFKSEFRRLKSKKKSSAPRQPAAPGPEPSPGPHWSRARVLRALQEGHTTAPALIQLLPEISAVSIYASLFDLREAGIIRSACIDGRPCYVVEPAPAEEFLKKAE